MYNRYRTDTSIRSVWLIKNISIGAVHCVSEFEAVAYRPNLGNGVDTKEIFKPPPQQIAVIGAEPYLTYNIFLIAVIIQFPTSTT